MSKNKYEIIRDIKDSVWFRTLLYPYGCYKFNRYVEEYNNSEYPSKIKKFENIHCGERCFVIGNGPSLSSSDLDLIKDEKTFAVNKIYNIFPMTEWRPTYYLCMDYLSMIEEIASEINLLEAGTIFLNWQQYKQIQKRENYIFCNFNPRYVINFWSDKKVVFSEDCSKYIDNARTVTYSALQMAVYMGFSEIYLLGVDNSFPIYKDGKGKKHFTDTKEAHFKNGGYNRVDYMVKETNEYGYKIAQEYCMHKGVKIYNATRGGKLEVFPRVSLEEVLKKE